MSDPIKARLRKRIMNRLRKMKADLTQNIDDIESWNDNRADEMPFDSGWDRCLLHCVTKELEAWESDDLEGVRYWGERMRNIADSRNTEITQ